MKKNIGSKDKTIRIIIAAAIAVMSFTNILSGNTAIVAGIIALALLATSFLNFCPVYLPFKINTNKK